MGRLPVPKKQFSRKDEAFGPSGCEPLPPEAIPTSTLSVRAHRVELMRFLQFQKLLLLHTCS